MAEEFEDRDLSESVFWGVRLNGALFRDADLTDARFFHTQWTNVSVDGVIDHLVVNGVDVTDYVNQHDRWYPLRNELSPPDADGIRRSWRAIQDEWTSLLGRVSEMGADVALESVNGEWSLRDTFRHLLFAMEKWFTWPVLGARSFTPCALPNTGSQGQAWPGLDLSQDPSFDEVLALRAASVARFSEFIASLNVTALPEQVEIPENGDVPTLMCFHVVLEEEFEHLRYALRDLEVLSRR